MPRKRPELNKREKSILKFIEKQIMTKGYPPSVREIGKAVGLSSTATVHGYLAKLEDGTKLEVDGLFVAQGVAGSTDFARKLGALVKDNKIVVSDKMETTIQGLYACGDCVGGIYQIAKAINEGMIAGISAVKDK